MKSTLNKLKNIINKIYFRCKSIFLWLDYNERKISRYAYYKKYNDAYKLSRIRAQRNIKRLTRKQNAYRCVKKLDVNSRIFINGYFYSGSGAVLDFLKGFSNIKVWPPVGEMRLIKFPGGIKDLADRFTEKGKFDLNDLLDFYLHIMGMKKIVTNRKKYDIWRMINRTSLKLRAYPEAHGYIASCLNTFLELDKFISWKENGINELENFFRTSIEKMFDEVALSLNASMLVVDQAVTAWRLPIARFIPPSVFIIIHRDPRDQFAESRNALMKSGRTVLNAAEFSKQYRDHRTLVKNTIISLEKTHGHRFIQISFEEFINNFPSESENIKEFLGKKFFESKINNFNPEKSKKNIGKYSYMVSDKDCEIITKMLPEYLWKV